MPIGVVFPEDIDQPVPALGGGPARASGARPRLCDDPEGYVPPVAPGPGLGVDLSNVPDDVPALGGAPAIARGNAASVAHAASAWFGGLF